MAATVTSHGSSPVAGSMSVDQVTRMAQEYEYDHNVPFLRWIRSAASIQHQADIYEHEGRLEQAYMLLFRYSHLVLSNITTHPDARKPLNKPLLKAAENQVGVNLKRLEALKPKIAEQHVRYVKSVREREARRASTRSRGSLDGSSHSSSTLQPLRSDPALANGARTLEAGEHKEFAVKVAQREISRRAIARKATRQAGISPNEEHQRRSGGVWGQWENDFSRDVPPGEVDDVSRHLQAARSQAEPREARPSTRTSETQRQERTSSRNYRYPSVPSTSTYRDWSPSRPIVPSPPPISAYESPSRPPVAPTLPPKELYRNGHQYFPEESLPPRPEKVSVLNTPTQTSSAPTIMASSKTPPPHFHSTNYTFKPSAYLENGSPLRTIFLPSHLRNQFLNIAQPNTDRNLETCGVLCGTLVCNALFISKLVIPEQKSTSDTCETVNESALFDYCDSEDLMVLGWIHTHPTQTCFMSSRDLHTHCGYQVMMPESIAIVCAPKYGDWGVFRLTDPPGMKSVLNCHQTGLFHPHSDSNLYTDALRPGHVMEADGMKFETVDLRPET